MKGVKAIKKFFLALFCMAGTGALLTAVTIVFLSVLSGAEEAGAQAQNELTAEAPAASSRQEEAPASSKEAAQAQPEDWRLLLVNFETPMPEGSEPELEKVGNIQVDKRIVPELEKMIEDAGKEGLTLSLSSGYRSAERQGELFQNAVEENLSLGMNREMAEEVAAESVARAGYSEHNTGLAIDLNGVLENFDETAEYRWLQRHAHEYGFVLRYPGDKSELAGIRFEPWHFRYVGRENAEKMKLLDLCLEEYVAYLGERPAP